MFSALFHSFPSATFLLAESIQDSTSVEDFEEDLVNFEELLLEDPSGMEYFFSFGSCTKNIARFICLI